MQGFRSALMTDAVIEPFFVEWPGRGSVKCTPSRSGILTIGTTLPRLKVKLNKTDTKEVAIMKATAKIAASITQGALGARVQPRPLHCTSLDCLSPETSPLSSPLTAVLFVVSRRRVCFSNLAGAAREVDAEVAAGAAGELAARAVLRALCPRLLAPLQAFACMLAHA